MRAGGCDERAALGRSSGSRCVWIINIGSKSAFGSVFMFRMACEISVVVVRCARKVWEDSELNGRAMFEWV